ncbi:EAL and GGDEF domain-containing protein [Metasolibacillus meyeri]|uniref:sensor domain-containing protein n=1 Tax=Metasolibacillus meyeri TaxID=1071052 RepID=UPI000D2FA73D|nr:GGDEF domain-containing phosphodiesterase [Metasolibacillus meyeri]
MYKNNVVDRGQLYFSLCQVAKQFESGLVILDAQQQYNIIFANNIFANMVEYSNDELIGSTLSLLTGPLTDSNSEALILESLQLGLSLKLSIFHYRKDQTAFWNELSILPIRDHESIVQFYIVAARDITDSINVEALITVEREAYSELEQGANITDVFEHLCRHIATTLQKKSYTCIFLINQNRLKLTASNALPEKMQKIFHMMDNLNVDYGSFLQAIRKERYIVHDLAQHSKEWAKILQQNGIEAIWHQAIKTPEGELVGIFSLFFEESIKLPRPSEIKFLDRVAPIITLALKYFNQKQEILQLAYYDEKTGLPNFALFQNELTQFYQEDYRGVICIIEPGEYQRVVDLYGRQGGDALVLQLAQRAMFIPAFENALIARYTNSSVILASKHTIDEELEGLLHEIIVEPFTIEGKSVYITLKIGTSNYGQFISSTEAVKRADTALSVSLKSAGTTMKVYDESQVQTLQLEMEVLSSFSYALKNMEFTPVLQPKVNIQTGQIEGFEALARWFSESLGFVSPAIFIPVAENTGNIHKVDRVILRKILAWQKTRQDTGKQMYQIAVNISPNHFYDPHFVENMKQLINEYGVEPRYIKFEITESVELENMIRAKGIINELKAFGIAMSIDDFGVGYSSLGYLKELPFDEIKIDKSFIDHLTDGRMNAVVRTLIQLSADLNMKSVAEGIETEEQHLELQKIGCQVGQGYYYYKPMTLSEVEQLLDYETLPPY